MKLKHVSRSATGLVRKENEDCLVCLEPLAVYAVADGMGGGAEGARASRMVCEAIERGVSGEPFAARLGEIRSAIASANSAVRSYAAAHALRQMGSTAVVLALDATANERAAIAYVGDSRAYRIRDGFAELLTRDHSVGAELEARVGAVGAKFSARSNPLAHVLTRAIGVEARVEPEWRKVDVRPGDRFLLCSDGVHDVIPDELLATTLREGALAVCADHLEREIVAKNAPDNYTFILIEIGGEA